MFLAEIEVESLKLSASVPDALRKAELRFLTEAETACAPPSAPPAAAEEEIEKFSSAVSEDPLAFLAKSYKN